MATKILNLALLISVTIEDKRKLSNMWWSKGWKIFGKQIFPPGFTSRYDSKIYSAEDLRKGELYGEKLIVESTVVYHKPKVTLVFTDGSKFTKRFETLKEATAWGEEKARKGMNVTLTEVI